MLATTPTALAQLPARGPEKAVVEIVEFCDFESEACARVAVVLHVLVETYPDDVRLTFRHVAPPDHQADLLSYSAVLAAAGQQRGWEMWDMVFANQDRRTREGLMLMARQLRLDEQRFAEALDNGKVESVSAGDREAAGEQGIEAGPVLTVNGKKLSGEVRFEELKALVEGGRRR
jgi:protein-disulfide isomerase